MPLKELLDGVNLPLLLMIQPLLVIGIILMNSLLLIVIGSYIHLHSSYTHFYSNSSNTLLTSLLIKVGWLPQNKCEYTVFLLQPQLAQIPTTEPGVVHFKADTLQCRLGLDPQHLQSLHIKINAEKDSWTPEELQILEKFFDMRAGAPPFKPNALCCFGRMLSIPYNVLKDFVQIMKLELVSNHFSLEIKTNMSTKISKFQYFLYLI